MSGAGAAETFGLLALGTAWLFLVAPAKVRQLNGADRYELGDRWLAAALVLITLWLWLDVVVGGWG